MIEIGKEYFFKPYYFFLTEKSDRISLYYSIGNTLNESKKEDEKLDFEKKDKDKVRKGILKILKDKKIKTKGQIKKFFEPVKKSGEIEEFIDADGTFKSSRIPKLDMAMAPRKTTDQTIVMARMTNNPVTRGYRRYYGESIEQENVMNEVDFSDAFGYEETKDMDGKNTYKYYVKKLDMDPDDAKQRTKQQGKDPLGKRTKKAPARIRKKPGFIDRMTLSEIEKNKMIKMVEDLLMKGKGDDREINEKEKPISKIVKKNIDSLKKIADREGITLNQLIKMLKSE
jgi:hypothetical protein